MASEIAQTNDDGPLVRSRYATARFGALVVVGGLLIVWFGWVERGGLGHPYYSASARTLAANPRWLLSGAFDPGGYVTVDKPPVGLWITALGASLGGASPTALILPSALASALAAGLSSLTVDRDHRLWVVALALSTPGLGVLARSSLPDATMLALGCAAAALVLSGAPTWRRTGGSGLLMGVAVLAKPGAVLMLPALVLAVVWTRRSWRDVMGFVAPLLLVIGVWVVLAELTPDRPYFGGSKADSAVELVVGPASVSRVVDADLTSGDRWIGLASAGEPGLFRVVTGRMGLQAGFLLMFALAAGADLLRSDRARLQAGFWLVWLVVHAVTYSFLPGIAHAYYAASLVPPIASLVVLWFGSGRRAGWLVLSGLAGSLLVTVDLADRVTSAGRAGALVLMVVGGIVAFAASARLGRLDPVALAGVAAVASVMVVGTVAQLTFDRTWTFDPAAGDRQVFEADDVAVRRLVERSDAPWQLVTDDEALASRLIAEHQLRVALVGGFLSRDRIVDADELDRMIAAGDVGFLYATSDVNTPAARLLATVDSRCVPVENGGDLLSCEAEDPGP